jgi:hypothetical protein
LECRYELALRRGTPSSSEHPMLTREVLLHLQLVQCHLQTLPDTPQRQGTENGVLPTFRESSPSSKLLQAQDSTIWWTNTCPWHGGNTTLQLHSSTMLGACPLQLHGAIYSQSRALGSWRSDDTVTTWSWDLQICAQLKATTLLPCLATSLSLVHQ